MSHLFIVLIAVLQAHAELKRPSSAITEKCTPAVAGVEAGEIVPQVDVYSTSRLTVEVVSYAAKNSSGANDYLVKFTGKAARTAGIEGRVIRYEGERRKDGDIDLVSKSKEKRMRLRPKSKPSRVNLDGRAFSVKHDPAQSKLACAYQILKEAIP